MTENGIIERMPWVPIDLVTAPFFASSKQQGGRVIHIGNKKITIGGIVLAEDVQNVAQPALDARHARLLFAIFTFINPSSSYQEEPIYFSVSKLCCRYANSYGSHSVSTIKALLIEISKCWICVEAPGEKTTYLKIFSEIEIRSRKQDNEPMGDKSDRTSMVTIHPVFRKLFMRSGNCTEFDLQTLKDMRSDLAKSIYLYIPSRALHRNEARPFEISIKTLLNQVGHRCYEKKSHRKKLFLQNKMNIITQLDKAPMSQGILRVKIAETCDKSDHKLLCWTEKKAENQATEARQQPKGVIASMMKKAGVHYRDVLKADPRVIQFDRYQLDLMKKAKINVEQSERFLKQALCIVGVERFNELIGEVKSSVIENRSITKTPSHMATYLLMQEIQYVIDRKSQKKHNLNPLNPRTSSEKSNKIAWTGPATKMQKAKPVISSMTSKELAYFLN